MIITTTSSVEGRKIKEYSGIVTGEAIVGAHMFKDMFAGLRDRFGGRAGSYEDTLRDARKEAFEDLEERAEKLGANAIVGVDLDYEVITTKKGGSMLMVTVSGTAVLVESEPLIS